MRLPALRFRDDAGECYPDWNSFFMHELGEFKNGINKSKEDFGHGVPFVNLMDVFGKPFLKNENLGLVNAKPNEVQNYNLVLGDVLFIRSSVKPEGVGETSVILEDLESTVYSGFLIRFREKSKRINLLYKKYCFTNLSFRSQILSVCTTSANTNINQESLNNLSIQLPCIEEQTKIANFLTAVDEKITQLTKKYELLTQYKKGVMQRIFSQELRFKDDDGGDFPEWEFITLEDVLSYEQPTKYLVSSVEYDDSYPTPVLTAGKTFILGYTNEQTGIFEDGLPVIIFDDFTTAFKFVNFPFKAKSSAMKILKNINKNNILKFIFEAMQQIDFVTGDEHKRYWISEYSKLTIPLPCTKEQTKIANFLTAIDDKITATQTQLQAVKQYKQGLLQQMFV